MVSWPFPWHGPCSTLMVNGSGEVKFIDRYGWTHCWSPLIPSAQQWCFPIHLLHQSPVAAVQTLVVCHASPELPFSLDVMTILSLLHTQDMPLIIVIPTLLSSKISTNHRCLSLGVLHLHFGGESWCWCFFPFPVSWTCLDPVPNCVLHFWQFFAVWPLPLHL